MKIEKTYNDVYYNEKSRFLGNCINLYIDNETYHYEFIINNNEATIFYDNLEYLEIVVEKFRFYNKYINVFKTNDGNFYKEYETNYVFKLPINILQVSQFFLNSNKITRLEKYLNLDEIYIPVKIINDEYVILDGHHRIYLAYINHYKMINVFIDDDISGSIPDFVYIAKEQNLNQIKDLQILPEEQYEELWDSFCENFFLYNN